MMWLLLPTLAQAEDLVIVLPGLGDSKKGRRHMAEWGEQTPGYTVVVPDYIERESVDASVASLEAFLEETDLTAYDEVHVFAYILGTWALNLYLEDHELPGLSSVVFNRSPIQERAPAVVHKRLTCATRIAFGPVLGDMADIPYPPVTLPEGVASGFIIENRATSLMRHFKRTALKMFGPLDWSVQALQHPVDDHLYTWVNHDEMYVSFDVIGPELLHFFEHGRFSDQAQREPSELDPWRRKP